MAKPRLNLEPKHSFAPGFERIAHWSEYERFRSGYLILLVVFNLLALVVNLGLALGASFAVTLVPLVVILAIGGTAACLRFMERIAKHFDNEPSVQKAIKQAETGQAPASHWNSFFRTVDGLLFGLGVLQFAVMIVLFWNRWH